MSLQAMVWAVEDAPDVPPHCLPVLMGLANHAGRDGRDAYPSVELLGHYARKGPRAVRNDLRELEEAGLIRKGDQRAAYDIPERYRPTVYDLAMERTRERYTPKRLRDVSAGDATESDDPGVRAELEAPPAAQGGSGVSAGRNHTPPEPPTNHTTNSERGTNVSRGQDHEPPQLHPDHDGRAPPAAPAGDDPEPPLRCPIPHDPGTPCRGCGDARRAHQAWEDREAGRRRSRDEAERAAAAQARALTAAEVAACRLCDDTGLVSSVAGGMVRCTHDPSTTTGRGRAAWAAAREAERTRYLTRKHTA